MQIAIQLVFAFTSLCWPVASMQNNIHQNTSVNPAYDNRHGKCKSTVDPFIFLEIYDVVS